MRSKISLLHPTFFREGGPSSVHDAWLSLAKFPERIEYLFAVTSTDGRAMTETSDENRIVVEPTELHSTSVQNWNALAERSTGDLIFVIADDLTPLNWGWDEEIDKLTRFFPPRNKCFVIKIDDNGNPFDTQLRHPLVSRKHYLQHGLWDKRFRGVWVDRDLSLSAFWRSKIIDGRKVPFIHDNPVLDPTTNQSISFLKANSAAEYEFGEHQFKKKWHPVLQSTRVRLHAAENDQKHLGPWQFLRSREAIRLLWNSRFFWPLRKFFLKRKTFVSKKFQVTKR